MKKILLYGSKGQLGTDIQTVFKDQDLICSNVDILKVSSLQRELIEIAPDVIINCAAYTDVDGAESHVEDAYDVNYKGVKNLATLAAYFECKLIHISTDYVFDGSLAKPLSYDETDMPKPISEYGKSKLYGEIEVIDNCKDGIVLRTSWLYSDHHNNFLKSILKTMYNEGRIHVVDDQWGTPTHSMTVAKQLLQLIDSRIAGIVHASSDGICNRFEVAKYFLGEMDCNTAWVQACTSDMLNQPAPRPMNSMLNNGVLNRLKISEFSNWKEEMDQFIKLNKDKLLSELK